jgi:hypothetical protein
MFWSDVFASLQIIKTSTAVCVLNEALRREGVLEQRKSSSVAYWRSPLLDGNQHHASAILARYIWGRMDRRADLDASEIIN